MIRSRSVLMLLGAAAVLGVIVVLTLAGGVEFRGGGFGIGVGTATPSAGGVFPTPAVPPQFPSTIPLVPGSTPVTTGSSGAGSTITVSWRTQQTPSQVVQFYTTNASGTWNVVQRRNLPFGTEFELRGPDPGIMALVDVASQSGDGFAHYSVTVNPRPLAAVAAGPLPRDLGRAAVSEKIPWPADAQPKVWKAEEVSNRALAVFLCDAGTAAAEDAELNAAMAAGWSVQKRTQYASGDLVTMTNSTQQLQVGVEDSALWAGQSQITVVLSPK